jgi:hypothetical protein
VIAAITQGLFFSLIRYKYAKGVEVSNMDIMCYNLVAAFAVCVGRKLRSTHCYRTASFFSVVTSLHSHFLLFDIFVFSAAVSLCLNPNLRDVNGIEVLFLIVDGVVVLVLSAHMSE